MILSKDLNKCRTERDQYKLLAEDIQNRLSNIKANVRNKVGIQFNEFLYVIIFTELFYAPSNTFMFCHLINSQGLHRAALYTDDEESGFRPGVTIADMLRDAQKRNKTLRMEIDDLKQQLCEAYEDMEVSIRYKS